jgi:hypothetical protein
MTLLGEGEMILDYTKVNKEGDIHLLVVMVEGRRFKVCHELEDVLIFGFEGMGHAAMDDRTKCPVCELETAHMYACKDLY